MEIHGKKKKREKEEKGQMLEISDLFLLE